MSDIIAIVTPHETALLDHLGDAPRQATSTIHEWLEDSLLPNTDAVDDASITNPATETTITVAHGDRFQEGDQIKLQGKDEVMLVTAVSGDDLGLVRQYGGSPSSNVEDGDVIQILGNAALEGDAAPGSRFTNRVRKQNYTQIFTASVEVSGSQLATQSIGVADEMDYQKQERLRELLRDLENCVINGYAASANPQGDASTRRTMRGIVASIVSNRFEPGSGVMPDGDGAGSDLLNEAVLNAALREIWEQSAGSVDTIVCNGFQKRRINEFLSSSPRVMEHDGVFGSMVDVYESDFGVCRVVLSRWAPPDSVLLLDSARIDVPPLSGRSFHFKSLASAGDSEVGQVIGEYTLELRNENAHGLIQGLGVTA